MFRNPYESPREEVPEPAFSGTSEPNEIAFSGCLNVRDIEEADKLLVRWHYARQIFAYGVCIVIACAIISQFPAILTEKFGPRTLLCVVGFVFLCLLNYKFVSQRWKLNKLAREQVGAFAYSEAVALQDRLIVTSGPMRTEYMWAAFRSFRANDQVAVVFLATIGQILIFSRRNLHAPGDWQGFVKRLETNLPRQ